VLVTLTNGRLEGVPQVAHDGVVPDLQQLVLAPPERLLDVLYLGSGHRFETNPMHLNEVPAVELVGDRAEFGGHHEPVVAMVMRHRAPEHGRPHRTLGDRSVPKVSGRQPLSPRNSRTVLAPHTSMPVEFPTCRSMKV
jgi:hypothetical protein